MACQGGLEVDTGFPRAYIPCGLAVWVWLSASGDEIAAMWWQYRPSAHTNRMRMHVPALAHLSQGWSHWQRQYALIAVCALTSRAQTRPPPGCYAARPQLGSLSACGCTVLGGGSPLNSDPHASKEALHMRSHQPPHISCARASTARKNAGIVTGGVRSVQASVPPLRKTAARPTRPISPGLKLQPLPPR